MYVDLIPKTLKIINMVTTNALLIKLTTIVYFYKAFQLAKSKAKIKGRKRA